MAVYVWEDELLEVLPGLGEPKYEPVKAIAFHTRSTSNSTATIMRWSKP